MAHADQAFSHRGMAAYLEIVGHVEAIVTLEAAIDMLRYTPNCPLAAAELRELAADLEALPEEEAPDDDDKEPSKPRSRARAKAPASTTAPEA